MGDLLRQGGQWLEQQRTAHCSSQVTYRRAFGGEATELVVNATFGRTEYEVEDDYRIRVGAQMTDFLIMPEELSPTLGEPKAGDRIIADGVVYEVMAFGQDFRGWRWSDPYRTTMRIHTKEVASS